jgi:hypothetical protein
MSSDKEILTTFFVLEKILPFSKQKEEKQHWTTSKIQYVDTNSFQFPLFKSGQRVLSQSEFFTTAHSRGKNERNVDKWKQRRSVRGRTVRAGVRNMALLQGDIMHVTTNCKSDGIFLT